MPAPVQCPLRAGDRARVKALLKKGVQQVRVVLRALALLHLDRGGGASATGRIVGLSAEAVRGIAQRYRASGFESAIYEKARPGADEVLTVTKQRIIAMVCSRPPDGAARWTTGVIAEEAIRRKLVPTVGRETIRLLLHTHDLKPWREKQVVPR